MHNASGQRWFGPSYGVRIGYIVVNLLAVVAVTAIVMALRARPLTPQAVLDRALVPLIIVLIHAWFTTRPLLVGRRDVFVGSEKQAIAYADLVGEPQLVRGMLGTALSLPLQSRDAPTPRVRRLSVGLLPRTEQARLLATLRTALADWRAAEAATPT